MKTKLTTWVVCSFILAACNKPAEQAASTFDLEKTKAVIEEQHQKFMAAISKMDSVGYSTLYHSQGIVFPPNMGPVSGQDKIRAFGYASFKMGITGVSLHTTDIWGDQDFIVAEGTYEVNGKDGATLDKGKYIEIWREENGQWKMYRDMWNTNTPMPAPTEKKK